MEIELRKFDVSNYLESPEDMAMYLEIAIEEANGDDKVIARALEDIKKVQMKVRASEDPVQLSHLQK